MPVLPSVHPGLIAAVLALALAGCTTSPRMAANPVAAPGTQASVAEAVRHWGERFERSPGDEQVAFAYSRALLAQDQRQQAVAVLRRSVLANQNSRFLKGELGKALAANGELQEALQVFAQAHTPDRPDWRILSAQGAVLDQLGRPEEAKRTYESALRIAPNEPSVLSNYGLSLALSGDLPGAERQLRRASELPNADQRVRQNLAMVVGLQGRFQEAEVIARKDLPPQEAERNVAMIRRMLSERNTWAAIRNGNGRAGTTQVAQAAPATEPARPQRGPLAATVLAEQAQAAATPAAPPQLLNNPRPARSEAGTATTGAAASAATSEGGASGQGGAPSLLTSSTTRRERVSAQQAEALIASPR